MEWKVDLINIEITHFLFLFKLILNLSINSKFLNLCNISKFTYHDLPCQVINYSSCYFNNSRNNSHYINIKGSITQITMPTYFLPMTSTNLSDSKTNSNHCVFNNGPDTRFFWIFYRWNELLSESFLFEAIFNIIFHFPSTL